jgi:hypothetical protein
MPGFFSDLTRPLAQAALALYTPPAASAGVLLDVPKLLNLPSVQTLGQWPGANIAAKLPTGDVYFEGQLALDTDGSRFQKLDGTGQPSTGYHPGGRPLDSDTVPYFSIRTDAFFSSDFGLKYGDYAAVIYGSTVAFAVLGDSGGKNLGEGSIELHRQLGFERIRNRGKKDESFVNASIDNHVITIAFPGSADGKRPTKESVRAAGIPLWVIFHAKIAGLLEAGV